MPSRLNKWVLPKPKAYKDDEEIKDKEDQQINESVLIKDKTSKINWGERRATLLSYPHESMEITYSNDQFKCKKFDVQFKNKTKWPWKKGCSLNFLK